jgi:hypothetical protein
MDKKYKIVVNQIYSTCWMATLKLFIDFSISRTERVSKLSVYPSVLQDVIFRFWNTRTDMALYYRPKRLKTMRNSLGKFRQDPLAICRVLSQTQRKPASGKSAGPGTIK